VIKRGEYGEATRSPVTPTLDRRSRRSAALDTPPWWENARNSAASRDGRGRAAFLREDAMGSSEDFGPRQVARRKVLRYGAGVGAAAVVVGGNVASAGRAHAAGRRVLPAPTPIPGGLDVGLHVFAPGPRSVTLPFSGFQLQGLDVEPSVFTDFAGFSAVAFHAGTAIGSDGLRYNLETDMRAYRGQYRAADGTRRRGVFGFV
jgi:hypothetical protein